MTWLDKGLRLFEPGLRCGGPELWFDMTWLDKGLRPRCRSHKARNRAFDMTWLDKGLRPRWPAPMLALCPICLIWPDLIRDYDGGKFPLFQSGNFPCLIWPDLIRDYDKETKTSVTTSGRAMFDMTWLDKGLRQKSGSWYGSGWWEVWYDLTW